ncbi:MAG: hypothetical protein JNK63_11660 [Chthonomonas sp.]|nr:hypothetical protein [Chthonomonas sp.]
MRALLLLTLAPVFASAQIVGPEHMDLALGVLRGVPGLTLVLRGSDQLPNCDQAFRVNFYYEPARTSQGPKAAIWSYRDGVLDRQLVADGADLYRYDPVMKQYSISSYRDLSSLKPMIQAMARGNMARPVQLWLDILASEPWRQWIRRADLDTSTPLQLRYENENDLLSLVFADPFVPDSPRLIEMRGNETRGTLTTSWAMSITPSLPSNLQFAFTVPSGAKPVSAPASVRTPD